MKTELHAIATCCRNSAAMLELCDQGNRRFQELNAGQAGLLRKAADMADALANEEAGEPGFECRHDHVGFYICTIEEALSEDAGNISAGFDGRPHFDSVADAWRSVQ